MNVDGPASYFLNYGWGAMWGWAPSPGCISVKVGSKPMEMRPFYGAPMF